MEFLGNDKRVIGSYQLDDYQADAIKNIYMRSYDILVNKNKEEILLHAPVGSGKTIMGAFSVNFFKRQMEELGYNEPISYIWISPDTGGINEQSKDSFLDILQEVNVLDIQQAKTEKRIPEDNILFVNWEKLTKSGNLMKEHTEKIVFKDIMENTHTKKVLIIDEAHIDWTKSDDSEESRVMQMIAPDLIINLTATPDKRLIKRIQKENKVYISYKTVQDAGIIKNRLIVNDGIDSGTDFKEDIKRTGNKQTPLLDVEQLLILKAIEKRNYLEEKSKELNGVDYLKPLILIQIPNANALEEITLQYVLDYLEEQLIPKDKIGIWLAETKINIDNLNEGDVEYLITKQAVTTGWNCPRAHILVKLRETGSINFDIQTIGRVMRIPRELNYSNDDLRSAFIFTPHNSFKYKGSTSNAEKEAIDELTKENNESLLKEDFTKKIGRLGVPMFKKVRTKDVYLTTDKFYKYLKENISNSKYIYDKKAQFEVKATEEIEDLNIADDIELSDTVIRKDLTNSELKRNYMQEISASYNLMNLEPYISDIIYSLLVQHDSKIAELSYEEVYNLIYNFYYVNKDAISWNISTAIKQYEHDDEILQTVEDNYIVQEKIYLGPLRKKTNDKFSYTKEPALEKESTPEENFQKFLNRQEEVKYWFKNGTSAKDFSIVYEDEGTLREYYPDFFVFDLDDNLYVLDTKANFEDDDYETTEAKYNAGVDYINKERIQMRFKELGFNDLTFSMIKYMKGKDTPFVLYEENYTNNPTKWEQFSL